MTHNHAVVDKKSKTIIDFLMNIPLFDGLRGKELELVAKHMVFFEIERGDTLFKEGEKGDCVCFVVGGGLNVIKTSAKTGKKTVIARVTKNHSIGEMTVIDNTRRSATVKAYTHSSILALTQKGFNLILGENPTTGIKILKQLARLMSMYLRRASALVADFSLPVT